MNASWCRALVLVALSGLGTAAGPALSAPWVPDRDDVVVERLPQRLGGDRAARLALRAAPADLGVALRAARAAIDRARQTGDPRSMGEAQAALAPWWSSARPPASVRLLRATILQRGHDFRGALVDLDTLIAACVPVQSAGCRPLPSAGAADRFSQMGRVPSAAAADAARAEPDLGQVAQALLTRSSLHLLQGRLDAAAQDCASLGQLLDPAPSTAVDPSRAALPPTRGPAGERVGRGAAVVSAPAAASAAVSTSSRGASGLAANLAWHSAACAAEVASRRGQPASAAAEFARLAGRAAPADAGWLSLLRGEAAARRGEVAAADRFLQDAVRAAGDVYNRSAWVDHLLQTGRAREALKVLDDARARNGDGIADVSDADTADADLLRRAIAWRALGNAAPPGALEPLTQRLADGFAAARLRGDAPHAREEARFELEVRGRPPAALVLATANWAEQREPIDAWLLVRSALAAGEPAAAEPVRQFQAETGYQDRRLEALDARFGRSTSLQGAGGSAASTPPAAASNRQPQR